MPIRIGQRPDHGFDEPLGLLSDCHRRIEHFLAILGAIAGRSAGGPLTERERAALLAAIVYFATAAPKHTADEEDSVFPRLRRSQHPEAERALDIVAALERDHEDAGRLHATVDSLVRRWLSEGQLSTADVADLGRNMDALQTIYRRHIDVEDRDLFPAAARAFSAEDLRAIGREMAARRTVPVRLTPSSNIR